MCIFDYGKVKDPEYFSEGRCEAHSDHVVYASWEEYREKKSSFYVSLDGLWKFAYARNYGQAVPGFEAPAFDCSGWDDIRVPASIQMEGWDIPQYVMSSIRGMAGKRLFPVRFLKSLIRSPVM